MPKDYIKKRITVIQELISEARYDEAFQTLEELITDIDGKEVENIRERELLDQLIGVKARYNFFKQQVIKGIQEGNTELNQITGALLSLTNELKEMGEKDPSVFEAAKEEEEKEYTAHMTTEPPLTATKELVDDGSQNGGCLLAIDKNNVNFELKDVNWSKLLLRALIGLAAIAALIFFLWRGCDGCFNRNTPVPPDPGPTPVVPADTASTDTGIKEPPKIARGKNCEELGLGPGKLCDLADFLSNPDNANSRRIELDKAEFKKNSLSYKDNSQAEKQLNDLVKLLREYPDANVDLYGYLFEGEDPLVKGQGNKEFSLDDVRAKKVYSALSQKGIDESRMDFFGDGDSNRAGVWIDFKM